MSRFASTESTAFTSNTTACQIVELRLIAVNPPERIGLYRNTRPSVERTRDANTTIVARRESAQDARDRIEAQKLTPPSHILREMARESPPPQEWWDEDFEGL